MKKAILILLTLASFCLSLFCPFVSFQKTVATGNDDIEDIGYLYTIQFVSTTTKVIITDNNIFTYLNDIGRYYTYEWIDVPIGGDDPSPGTLGGGTIAEPNGGTIRVKQYYYYATPTEPKIIGRTMLDNTVYSLRIALQYLENLATHYGNCTNTKDSILGYIRSISNRYVDAVMDFPPKWGIVCGPVDHDFVDYVDSITSVGMTIREYLASFVKSSEYNDDEHSSCGNNYLQKELFLFDPINQAADIDLIHMFACMDGLYLNSGNIDGNPIFNYFVTSRTYRYLLTWAGDLQYCTKALWDDEQHVITSFYEIMSGEYGFDWKDFYADVDSINMTYGVSINDTFLLSSVVYTYYQNLTTNTSRITTFVTNIIHLDNVNATLTFNNIKIIVYEMLALQENGESVGPSNYPYHYEVKYNLLGYQGSLNDLPDVTFRENVAARFSVFLWGLVS